MERDIIEVIKMMQIHAKKDSKLWNELETIKKASRYTAPESMILRWGHLSEVMETHIEGQKKRRDGSLTMSDYNLLSILSMIPIDVLKKKHREESQKENPVNYVKLLGDGGALVSMVSGQNIMLQKDDVHDKDYGFSKKEDILEKLGELANKREAQAIDNEAHQSYNYGFVNGEANGVRKAIEIIQKYL
jgi:flagellin-specific chaperone FliS